VALPSLAFDGEKLIRISAGKEKPTKRGKPPRCNAACERSCVGSMFPALRFS
jgi:hypothetical protein